jgi:hypothetical protein
LLLQCDILPILTNPQPLEGEPSLRYVNILPFLSKRNVFTYLKWTPLPGAGGSEIQQQTLHSIEKQFIVNTSKAIYF